MTNSGLLLFLPGGEIDSRIEAVADEKWLPLNVSGTPRIYRCRCTWPQVYGKRDARIKISLVRAFASRGRDRWKVSPAKRLVPERRQFLDNLIGDAPWQFLHSAASRHVSARSRVNQGIHGMHGTRTNILTRAQHLVAKECSPKSPVTGRLFPGDIFLQRSETTRNTMTADDDIFTAFFRILRDFPENSITRVFL